MINIKELNYMKKNKISIGLEFIFGPIQKYEYDKNNNLITGFSVIDNDEIIQNLDKEINQLWCSLWISDSNESSGYYFDKVREKQLAPYLLEKITELIDRINVLNDGSFEVVDMITNHLKKII